MIFNHIEYKLIAGKINYLDILQSCTKWPSWTNRAFSPLPSAKCLFQIPVVQSGSKTHKYFYSKITKKLGLLVSRMLMSRITQRLKTGFIWNTLQTSLESYILSSFEAECDHFKTMSVFVGIIFILINKKEGLWLFYLNASIHNTIFVETIKHLTCKVGLCCINQKWYNLEITLDQLNEGFWFELQRQKAANLLHDLQWHVMILTTNSFFGLFNYFVAMLRVHCQI